MRVSVSMGVRGIGASGTWTRPLPVGACALRGGSIVRVLVPAWAHGVDAAGEMRFSSHPARSVRHLSMRETTPYWRPIDVSKVAEEFTVNVTTVHQQPGNGQRDFRGIY